MKRPLQRHSGRLYLSRAWMQPSPQNVTWSDRDGPEYHLPHRMSPPHSLGRDRPCPRLDLAPQGPRTGREQISVHRHGGPKRGIGWGSAVGLCLHWGVWGVLGLGGGHTGPVHSQVAVPEPQPRRDRD